MKTLLIALAACATLSGCGVIALGSAAVSVVTLPVKAVYHTGAAVGGAVFGDDEDDEQEQD